MNPTTTDPPVPAAPGDGSEQESPAAPARGAVIEETKQQGKRLGKSARHAVLSKADRRKAEFARELHEIAESLDELSRTAERRERERIAQLAKRSASMVRRASDELASKDAEALVDAAEQQIRHRPGPILAGCLAVGFLAARILRV